MDNQILGYANPTNPQSHDVTIASHDNVHQHSLNVGLEVAHML
jgi:hypothetical protein